MSIDSTFLSLVKDQLSQPLLKQIKENDWEVLNDSRASLMSVAARKPKTTIEDLKLSRESIATVVKYISEKKDAPVENLNEAVRPVEQASNSSFLKLNDPQAETKGMLKIRFKGKPLTREQEIQNQKLMEVEGYIPDDPMNEPDSKQIRALKDRLLWAVDQVIHLKWSKALDPTAQTFARMGLPNGNPFTVRLTSESQMLPDGYLDVIEEPMDLLSIRQKIQEYEYESIDSFTHDLNLVISNALKFYKHTEDPMRRMAKQMEKRVSEVLAKLSSS